MKVRSQSKSSRQPYIIRKSITSESKINQQRDPIIFMLIDDEHIGMHLPYSYSNEMTKSLVKQNGGVWEYNFRLWKIPKSQFTPIRSELPRILANADIQQIPLFLDRAMKLVPEKLKLSLTGQIIAYNPMDRKIQPNHNPLFHKLYEFQKITLDLAIKNFGRLIIADQMGMGKTLQSLACALSFENDWPLLIICPSALKQIWFEEIKKWLGNRIKKENVQIVEKHGTHLDLTCLKIAIYSYETASKSIESLKNFKIVIVDEAHCLKNNNSQKADHLVPFLTSRKRVFLLSGTSGLAKPRQIYNLIQIVRPDIFFSLKEFGDRYCFLQKNHYSHKMEYEGCRNIAELHYLLKNRIMIRRLKNDVFQELPDKQRQIIELDTNKNDVKKIKQLMSSNQIPLDILRNNDKLLELGSTSDVYSPMPQCYLLTGLAKLQGIKNYLASLLENDVKILIFAHHLVMMDELEKHIKSLKLGYVRIDGSTSNDMRKKNVKSFQEDSSIHAALLSITCASGGITLNAASNVVFTELHWNPANLLQAQERVQREGQKSCINIHYLIGENTLDHILLKQLQTKLNATGEILNVTKQKNIVQNLEKGRSCTKFQPCIVQPAQRSVLEHSKKVEREESESSSDIEQDEIGEQELQKLIRKKQAQIKEKKRKNEGI